MATFHHWGDSVRYQNEAVEPKDKQTASKPQKTEKHEAKKHEAEQPAKPAEHKAEGGDAAPKDGYLVAHHPAPGSRKPSVSRSKDYEPAEEVHHESVHDTMPSLVAHGDTLTEQTMASVHHTHAVPEVISYIPLDTPHTLDPIQARPIDHPNVRFQSYEDFPPDFYKADYYGFYNDHVKELLPEGMIEEHYPAGEYKPLRIHSFGENGFYYHDDHFQNDFRHDADAIEQIFGFDYQQNELEDDENDDLNMYFYGPFHARETDPYWSKHA